MSNTFSQIYLQFVFAVQNRHSFIQKEHKEELHKYMTSLVQARKAKMLAIHCMPDHAHLFVGFKPSVLISDFVKEIKVQSNDFIASKRWIKGIFSWQEGYGVFSYGHSQIDRVCKYVLNQEAILFQFNNVTDSLKPGLHNAIFVFDISLAKGLYRCQTLWFRLSLPERKIGILFFQ